jgi:hydrogenase/urease accessory protein HupE
MKALLLCGALWLTASVVQAHPLAPALLQIDATDGEHYEVLWRSSLLRVRGSEVWPQWPANCTATAVDAEPQVDAESLQQRWTLHCRGGLTGQRLQVPGLDAAGINVLVKVSDGRQVQQTLLNARRSQWQVPSGEARSAVFGRYLRIGVEHLLLGPDHLLFVIGLVALVTGVRRLLWTVTAFTLGHSLTLGLAVLDRIRVSEALAEWGIALSLLLLAVTLARPQARATAWLVRFPASMAVAFGLIHGLGFAGALRDVGLPTGDIPLALLAFNLGIELGQILLIGVLLALGRLGKTRLLTRPTARLTPLTAYVIGSLAVFWLLQRSLIVGFVL